MLLQSRPTAEVLAQLALTQRCVDFAMADAVNRLLDFAATAFGQQVMLINAGTGHRRPAAKRAVRQIQRLDITQRLTAAQIAFGDHCLNEAGLVSVLACQVAGYGDIAADACQKNDALNVHERHVGGAPVFVVLHYLGSRFSSGACR